MKSHHSFIFGRNVALSNVNEFLIFISFVSTSPLCNRHEKSPILQRLRTTQHVCKGPRTSPLAAMLITVIRITLAKLYQWRPPLLRVRGTKTLCHKLSYISLQNIKEAKTPSNHGQSPRTFASSHYYTRTVHSDQKLNSWSGGEMTEMGANLPPPY